MGQRKAVTRATATRYRSATRVGKAKILDKLCEFTGWHRDHARRALREALGPHRVPTPRQVRPPTYDEDVMVALRTVWAVMDAPAGKRMAPFLPEMVARLRAFGSWTLTTRQRRGCARCRRPRSTAGWPMNEGAWSSRAVPVPSPGRC
jgi:hypothetical protein